MADRLFAHNTNEGRRQFLLAGGALTAGLGLTAVTAPRAYSADLPAQPV